MPDIESVYFFAHVGRSLKPVGILTLEIDEPAALIRTLLVDPMHRGNGVGGMLLEAAFGRARKVCKETCGLWLHEDNDGAERLYRRHGFVKYMSNGVAGYTQYIKVL